MKTTHLPINLQQSHIYGDIRTWSKQNLTSDNSHLQYAYNHLYEQKLTSIDYPVSNKPYHRCELNEELLSKCKYRRLLTGGAGVFAANQQHQQRLSVANRAEQLEVTKVSPSASPQVDGSNDLSGTSVNSTSTDENNSMSSSVGVVGGIGASAGGFSATHMPRESTIQQESDLSALFNIYEDLFQQVIINSSMSIISSDGSMLLTISFLFFDYCP